MTTITPYFGYKYFPSSRKPAVTFGSQTPVAVVGASPLLDRTVNTDEAKVWLSKLMRNLTDYAIYHNASYPNFFAPGKTSVEARESSYPIAHGVVYGALRNKRSPVLFVRSTFSDTGPVAFAVTSLLVANDDPRKGRPYRFYDVSWIESGDKNFALYGKPDNQAGASEVTLLGNLNKAYDDAIIQSDRNTINSNEAVNVLQEFIALLQKHPDAYAFQRSGTMNVSSGRPIRRPTGDEHGEHFPIADTEMTAVLANKAVVDPRHPKIIGLFFTVTSVRVHPFQEAILIYQNPMEDTVRLATVRKKGPIEKYTDDGERTTRLLSELNQQLSRCLPETIH